MLKTISETFSHADSLTTDQAHLTFLPCSAPINRIISCAIKETKAALCFGADLQTWLAALVIMLIKYLLNFGSWSDGLLLCIP